MPGVSSVENSYDQRRALKVKMRDEFKDDGQCMAILQSPVVEKVNEYETNLNGFLPHVVVKQEAGVPASNR